MSQLTFFNHSILKNDFTGHGKYGVPFLRRCEVYYQSHMMRIDGANMGCSPRSSATSTLPGQAPVFFMYFLFPPLLCNRGHITNPNKALLQGTFVLFHAPKMGNLTTPYKEPTPPQRKNWGIRQSLQQRPEKKKNSIVPRFFGPLRKFRKFALSLWYPPSAQGVWRPPFETKK